MAVLDVPVVVVVHGEGGSGGALGIAVGDRVLMHEFAIYSVIPPEGCAAILWRDTANARCEAAEALKITAPDLLRLGIVDEVVPEPVGGAHTDPRRAAQQLDASLRAGARRGDRGARPTPASSALPEVPAHGPGRDRRGLRPAHRVRAPQVWKPLDCDDSGGAALARELGVSPVVARLLAIRGLAEPDGAARFLKPSLDHLLDPWRLADLPKAVDRLMAAIANGERVAIHGDYDVDGITSTVILRRALELLGGDVVALHPRAAARRLRPAAGHRSSG